jgi:D-alanyl-lipoteichoic acid acyltransferase DltB (MBOAT superfamily)
MNFNSPQFFLFLPTVVFLYALVFRRASVRDLLLLSVSYVFYMSWNWRYAGLILLSTVVDYSIGRRLSHETRERIRKSLLITSLVTNLGLLGIFKYFNFFLDVGGSALSVFGMDLDFMRHRLLLPVGISFYTFQTLSYTIDLYRRKIPHERSFIKFALFVSFFPQLVAGPIVRASQFLPQLHRKPNFTEQRFNTGLTLIFRGLFKKIVIADMLAGLGVDAVFANPAAFSSLDLLLAVYGYSFQIYADFSGYSDIAIGAARMLGYDLVINFNRPYMAQNVREFWTRWHISLSTWLRDYLYIPLGGSRASPARVRFNLMITMLLGGLWHGAALNFIFWGGWHGLLLIFARGASKSPEASLAVRIRRRFLCFHLITFSWLLFRIGSWELLVDYVKGLLAFSGGSVLQPLFFFALALAFLTHFVSKDWVDRTLERFARLPVVVQSGAYAAIILLLVGLTFGSPAFIYFQF